MVEYEVVDTMGGILWENLILEKKQYMKYDYIASKE